jgi:23S rRNA pseudouridine1911/1915/1917 synthase
MADTPYEFTFTGDPTRLDKAIVQDLSAHHTYSRSQVERWIEDGRVSVGGIQVRKSSYTLESGDVVAIASFDDQPTELAPYQFGLSILYEDADLIVIDKPAGLSMHPGAGNAEKTLANAVVSHVGKSQLGVGEPDRPGIVHRLDKDTTGVVVVAKSTPVHAALAKQFAERTIDRAYQALVFTTPRARRPVQLADEGEVNAPVGRHPTNRKRMAIVEAGKTAITRWSVVERFTYGTLLECRLQTGRTHQIRVHMESIGSPIVGDRVYGDFTSLPPRLREAAERLGRQALHAYSLAFTHPSTGVRLSFSAPLPKDLEYLVDLFRSGAEAR